MNTEISEVNTKYVLKLIERSDKTLSVLEHPIKRYEILEQEIKAIVENEYKNTWDLYSKVISYCDGPELINYCYPYEYNNSYIDGVRRPKHVSYNEFAKYDELVKEKIIKECNFNNKTEQEAKTYCQNKLKEYYHQDKLRYAEAILRYIRCLNIYNTLQEIKKNEKVKMYSSDDIGWTTFTYSISEDIKVLVKTNFDYGASSFFYLIIKYKELVIIPYSDLVHYYYAEMKDLISYTRSYACKRESWHFALKFVEEFANKCIENPKDFIRHYILSEIEEMMKGLRATIKNPEEVLNRIKSSTLDYIRLNVIRPFNESDKELYEMMPSESISVFKAEKISGALEFIESLKQIEDLCPELSPIIEEIKDMNFSIKDEVEKTIVSINNDLKPLQEQKEKIDKEIELLNDKIGKHTKVIQNLTEGKEYSERYEIEEEYKKLHPELDEMKKERSELQDKSNELWNHIYKRTRLRDRMKVCLDRIEELNP